MSESSRSGKNVILFTHYSIIQAWLRSCLFFYLHGRSSTPQLKDKYNNEPVGPSVLVYFTEVNTKATGNKQIMILGFEEGWPGFADADYNDIVILLEGNLPEPTSKRFFCEDKKSFDWDYNDVDALQKVCFISLQLYAHHGYRCLSPEVLLRGDGHPACTSHHLFHDSVIPDRLRRCPRLRLRS